MKATIIGISIGIALSSFCVAHEGHDHGLSKEEAAKQVKAGNICVANDTGYSLGAVIEEEGKIFRCVKAYQQNLAEQKELVWVELTLKDKALVTLP